MPLHCVKKALIQSCSMPVGTFSMFRHLQCQMHASAECTYQAKHHKAVLAVCMNDRTLRGKVCLQMVLKCADIGHLAAPPRTHRRWAFQLEEEFFRQVPTDLAAYAVNICSYVMPAHFMQHTYVPCNSAFCGSMNA